MSDDLDIRRRRQLVVAFALLLGVGGFVTGTVHLARAGVVPGVVVGYTASALMFGIVLTRRRLAFGLTANLILFVATCALALGAVLRGGVGSPPAMVMAAVPLLAVFLLGRRGAAVWAAIVVAAMATMAVLRVQGIIGIDIQDRFSDVQRTIAGMSGGVVLMLILLFVGIEYERRRREALERVEERDADLRAAEAAVRVARSEHLASLDRLAAGAAHEINNPLSAVLANLSVLQREVSDSESAEAIEDAILGAKQIQRVVRDLQTYSRWEELQLSAVDVPRLIKGVLTMVSHEIWHRAQVVTELDEHVTHAFADESRLGQVVLNLVLNAAQAIPEGSADDNTIRICTWARGSELVIEVIDTGEGIAAEILPHVMDPFFTTKPIGQGTGLGLSACANLAKSMGGSLALESTPGSGTTARLTLRPASDMRVAPSVSTAGLPTVVGKARILIVDDDPMVTRALERIMRDQDLVVADGGKQAISILDRDADFGLIICDVMMPEVTGIDVHAHIAEHHAQLLDRFVVTSGGALSDMAREFLSTFNGPVLGKPFSEADLLELVAGAASVDRKRLPH